MATEIGSKGLAEVNLVIPQGTSLSFDVKHVDEKGNAVDNTASAVAMVFQASDGTNVQLGEYCTGTETGVHVAIPASVSSELGVGSLVWDMLVTTSAGDVIRMAYGKVRIVDTYAHDGA